MCEGCSFSLKDSVTKSWSNDSYNDLSLKGTVTIITQHVEDCNSRTSSAERWKDRVRQKHLNSKRCYNSTEKSKGKQHQGSVYLRYLWTWGPWLQLLFKLNMNHLVLCVNRKSSSSLRPKVLVEDPGLQLRCWWFQLSPVIEESSFL